MEVGSIVGKMELALDKWSASVEAVKKDQDGMAGFAQRHEKGIKDLGRGFTIAGGLMVGALGMAAKSAADAEETTSKFGVVFKPVMDDAGESLENLANNYGLSHDAARTMLSGTGDLLTGLGMSSGAALDLSTKTQQLAVDLASFQNYSGGAAGASEALTKGLLGQREMMQGLGIVINEEMLKERLLAQGKDKLTGLALMQARAYATLELATEQSKNAVGDFSRTQDSLVNQTRVLEARLTDLKQNIGAALLPVIQTVVTHFSKAASGVLAWTKEHPELTRTLTLVAGALGAVMLGVGPLLMALPKLAAGWEVLTRAKAGFNLMSAASGLAIGALVFEIAKYIDALSQAKKAIDYTDEAHDRMIGKNVDLSNKLYELVKAGKMTADQFYDMTDKYKGNSTAMAQAIRTGKEGKDLQDALVKVGKEHAKEVEAQTKAVNAGLTPALNAVAEKITNTVLPAARDWNWMLRDTWYYVENTAVPAARNLGDVWAGTQDYMVTASEDAAEAMKKPQEDVRSGWENVFSDLSQKFGQTIQDWISGTTSFKDFWNGIWGDIKDTFFRMIGDMVAKWVFDFLKSLIDDTAAAAGKAAKTLADLGKAATDTISDAAGVATSAVAGAATSVINTIANVVSAAAAVIGLFKKEDYGAIEYWLKKQWELAKEQHDWVFEIWRFMLSEQWDVLQRIRDVSEGIMGRVDTMISYLDTIAANTAGLANVPSYDTGSTYVPRTTLAVVHEGERIYNPANGAGGAPAGASVVINYAPVIQAMDAQDVYKFMAGPGRDALLKVFKGNVRGAGRELAAALGGY